MNGGRSMAYMAQTHAMFNDKRAPHKGMACELNDDINRKLCPSNNMTHQHCDIRKKMW